MKLSRAIFKTFFLSLAIIANVHFAFLSEGWAQTGGIIPNGKNVFLDQNGKPLSSGKVFFYVPSTTTPKTTYSDINLSIPNTNPVVLDAAGRAILWGTGNYRQIVQDKLGNTIWDVTTSAAGSGSGGGSIATGDGDLVGTIKPWAGMTAPNQYMFTYGQEVSRTTFSALFTAIASTQAIFCNSGSPILTGLGDTTNFWIGMSVEVGCVSGGVSTIISKTSSSVTLAANANLTENVNAIFFPWGRGNGTTTFNLPDFRGLIPMGNNIMGGVASSNVSDANFGTPTPESSGGQGGNQSKTLALNNFPPYTPTGTVAVRSSSVNLPPLAVDSGQVPITIDDPGSGTPRSIYVQGSFDTVLATFTGTQQGGGGIAATATIVAAGSGYTNGSQTITVAGGTCSVQPQFTVTVSGNVFTGTPALLTAGACTVAPTNPASTTGGGGTGGTLNVVYTPNSFSLIPPIKTVNYIIKVTPDANSATASGVTSLGGMTGSIACGSGLTCTGNVISSSSATAASPNNSVQFNSSGSFGGNAGLTYVAGGSLTISPTTPTNNQGLAISQTTPNTGSVAGPIGLNVISVTDQAQTITGSGVDAFGQINNQLNVLRLNYTVTGGSANHFGFNFAANVTGSNGGTVPTLSSCYINVGTITGDCWSNIAIGNVGPSGNLNQSLIGYEAEMLVADTGVVKDRIGFSAVSQGPTAATRIDASIVASVFPAGITHYLTAAPWGNFIYLSNNLYGTNTFPIASTGSIILSDTGTVTNFVSAHTLTVTGNIFDFPNVALTGPGSLNLNSSAVATNTPVILVSKNTTTGALGPLSNGSLLQLNGADATSSVMAFNSFGTGVNASILLAGARGTAASSSASQASDVLGFYSSKGFAATAYDIASASGMYIGAGENHTLAANGTFLAFLTVPNTTTSRAEAMRVNGSGGLSMSPSGTAIADPGAGNIAATRYFSGTTGGLASKSCLFNTTNVTTGITLTITGGLITGTTTC